MSFRKRPMSLNFSFAIPGDINTLTGGYGYDRRVISATEVAGADVRHLELPGRFPFPRPEDIAETLGRLRAEPPDRVLLIDGLAYAALPPKELSTLDRRLVALVHHPLGLETGLAAATSKRLIENERAALELANEIIVTSETTGETLIADFNVPSSKITVAEPGVDPAPRAAGSRGPTTALLAVGAIVPRKGYDVLIEALSRLRRLDWRLRIVGDATRAPDTARELRAQVEAAGLSDRIEFAGEMQADVLARAYEACDLFVLSSRYEGYGMVLSEAMARGLPIVATTGGAAARTVPDAAALKVPPGDAIALTSALDLAIRDAKLRGRLSDASWRAGQSLPRWDETTAKILKVLERVA
jgi:glycosyltransferase involved in cell wall biosynthesis